MEREDVSNPRRNSTTSAIFGRQVGSWFKQQSIISHNESVRPRFRAPCGRFGRVPSSVFDIISEKVGSLDEPFPAKTLGRIQIIHLSTFNAICRKVCRTNLYRDHTERNHVRKGSNSLVENHHWSKSKAGANCRGRHQTRQTNTTFPINGSVALIKGYLSGPKRAEENIYPIGR